MYESMQWQSVSKIQSLHICYARQYAWKIFKMAVAKVLNEILIMRALAKYKNQFFSRSIITFDTVLLLYGHYTHMLCVKNCR